MPALPAVPKVIRVDFQMSLGGNPNLRIRTFFQYSGALSLTDATTVVGTMRAAFQAQLLTGMVNVLSHTLTELTDLSSTTSPQVTDPTAGSGGNANPPLSNGTALVIKHTIARRYRGGHPRTYIPGLATTALLTSTAWASATISFWGAHWPLFVSAAVASPPAGVGTLTHVNVSYFEGFHNVTLPSGRVKSEPTLRAAPVVDTVIGTAVNPVPASQRRRNQTP